MTLDDLRLLCPKTSPDRLLLFVAPLMAAMEEFGIDSPKRKAAFLAQISHESGAFQYTRELWGPTDAQKRYEPPGTKAAELGNTDQGDGFRYRGRGLIQTTGKGNYRDTGDALGIDLVTNPQLLELPENAARSAGWFWKAHGLNGLADLGDFEKITRRINGGLNGEAERIAYWDKAKEVFA